MTCNQVITEHSMTALSYTFEAPKGNHTIDTHKEKARDMEHKYLLVLLICSLVSHINSNYIRRNCNRSVEGWTIENNACVKRVDNNCQNHLPFRSFEECQVSHLGLNSYCSLPDICNQGFCVTTRKLNGSRSYKCVCDGTGYYGKNCQTRCPRVFPYPRNYPVACIQI